MISKTARYFLYFLILAIIFCMIMDLITVQQKRADLRTNTFISGIYIINMKANTEALAEYSSDLDKLYINEEVKEELKIMSDAIYGSISKGSKYREESNKFAAEYEIKRGLGVEKILVDSEIIKKGKDKGVKLTTVYYIKPTFYKLKVMGIDDNYFYKVNITKNFRFGSGV